MKTTVWSRMLSLLLAFVLVLSTGILMPGTARAAEEKYDLKFTAADGTVHLLYWARGIQAPKLPEKLENDAPLAVPFDPEGNWYDLNLSEGSVADGAAAAANALHWWLSINEKNIEKYLKKEPAQPENYRDLLAQPQKLTDYLTPPKTQKAEESTLYQLLRTAGGMTAYTPDAYLDLFINGYPLTDHQNSPDAFSPAGGQGGYLFPVFDVVPATNRISEFDDYGVLGTLLRRTMQENCGMIMALSNTDGDIYYANVWGAEYGEDQKLTAIYLTGGVGGEGDSSMTRCRISPSEDRGIRISNMEDPSADGLKLETIYMLYSGTPNFAVFLGKRIPDMTYPDEYYRSDYIPAEPGTTETAWGEPSYAWSEDLSACTATREDGSDSENKETLEAQVVSEQTKAPGQDTPGVMTYVASFPKPWAQTQTRTQEIPALRDQWGETEYRWAEDMSFCKARRVSQLDETVYEVAVAEITSAQTKAPTETEKGETTYTARFQESWAEDQQKTVDDIPMAEPAWNAPQYSWNKDLTACTAIRTRVSDNSVTETAEAEISSAVTKEATEKRKGETTYTAEFREDWAEDQQKTVANIPKLQPAWNEPEYSWSEDLSKCTAVRSRVSDSSITETAEAEVSSAVTKEATEKNKGETTYTAEFREDWAEDQQKTVANIPALGEDWNAPEYQWSQDHRECRAVRISKSDKSISQTAVAKVTSIQTKEPTATEKGETTYTAEFTESWAQTQKETVADVPALGGRWGEPEYIWSRDNRQCKAVRTSLDDATVTQTAMANVTFYETKAPTETRKGETTYTAEFREDWAETQEKTVADVPMRETVWGEPTYTWSRDNRQCTAKRISTTDSKLQETASAKVTYSQTKAPTASQKGETTYVASFREDWAKDQTKTAADIPTLSGGSSAPTEDPGWKEPTYEWSNDHSRCTASRAKKNDPSNVVMAKGNVTVKEVKPATCQTPGESIYTATFSESWAKTQQATVEVKDGMHDLEQVPETPATATTAGMKAHYKCKLCGKLFADPEGTVEVTREELMLQKPAMSGSNAVVEAIPEKENTVALTGALLQTALDNYPEAKGLLINVGDATVVYSRETAQQLLKDHKSAKKLVLQVVKTDFGAGALTKDQALSLQRNTNGTLYQVSLTDGGDPVSAPCTVMVPYAPMGAGNTGVYLVAEDGSFHMVTSQRTGDYLAYNGDTGFYLASETEPEAQKAKGKGGLIAWIVVLVISGLLFLGGGGFLLYRKIQEDREDVFDSEPQFDQSAMDRIRAPRPVKPRAPETRPQTDMPAYRQPRTEEQPSYGAPVDEPTQAFVPMEEPEEVPAPEAVPAAEPETTPEAPAHKPAAAAPKQPYHGAFERRTEKPSMADKAVKAAHQNQSPRPEAQPKKEEGDPEHRLEDSSEPVK